MTDFSGAARTAIGYIMYDLFKSYADTPKNVMDLIIKEAKEYINKFDVSDNEEAQYYKEIERFASIIIHNEDWSSYHRRTTGVYKDVVDYPVAITASLRYLA